MKRESMGAGLTLRTRRRMIVAVAYALVGAGVAFGAAGGAGAGAAGAGRAPTATRPTTAPAKEEAKAQYQKAKTLYDAGKYAEANVENEKALRLDPASVEANLLKRVLASYIDGSTPSVAATGAAPASGKPGLLNASQISLIRIAEMSRNEPNMKGKIERPVLQEFWDEVYTKDPLGDKSQRALNEFLNPANFAGQLRVFKDSNQQKFLERVSVTTDPAILAAFRTSAHPYLLTNCATSECHGGEKGGNFRLVTSSGGAATTEQIYTNFYIMSMYAGKDGKMFDRDSPEKSLIMQYSLPWSSAAIKHPKVDIRKIPNMQDNRYRGMYDWIRSLTIPRPNYGITFELPGAATK